MNNHLTKFYGNVKTSISKHSPEILTGIGIAGMFTAIILAVKATPKAMKLIDLEIKRRDNKEAEKASKTNSPMRQEITKLKPIDTVKATWKCYIPSAVIAAASTGCLIGASSVHIKRNAILATAYQLSESAAIEYKEKVIEAIGEKKEKAISDEVSKSRVEKNPVSKNEIIVTGNGETLCYDYYSKRYFKSNIDRIKAAVNKINSHLLEDSYVSLNDFYSEIGLEGTEYGDDVGWNAESTRNLIDVRFSSQLSDQGTPCLVLDFEAAPKYNFNKFY